MKNVEFGHKTTPLNINNIKICLIVFSSYPRNYLIFYFRRKCSKQIARLIHWNPFSTATILAKYFPFLHFHTIYFFHSLHMYSHQSFSNLNFQYSLNNWNYTTIQRMKQNLVSIQIGLWEEPLIAYLLHRPVIEWSGMPSGRYGASTFWQSTKFHRWNIQLPRVSYLINSSLTSVIQSLCLEVTHQQYLVFDRIRSYCM